jgi:DNA-binding MarR family transcriptional regulator
MQHDYVDNVQEQWRRVNPDINNAPAAIIHRMRRLAQLIARQSEVVLADRGLSRADFDILALLTRTGEPLTPSELAEDLITSGPGTTKRIKKLVDAGLVTREANPADGRGALIHLTKHGHDTIIPALRCISDFETGLLDVLSEPNREELAGLLRQLLLFVESPSEKSE